MFDKDTNVPNKTGYISREFAVHNMECYPWDTEHDRNAAIHLVRELVPAAGVRPLTLDTPYMEDAIEAVIEERRRQISLYGDQSNLLLLSWPGILGEEFGELCEAFGETVSPPSSRRHPERGGLDNIFREACHVAAVAVQIMEIMKKIRAEEMED